MNIHRYWRVYKGLNSAEKMQQQWPRVGSNGINLRTSESRTWYKSRASVNTCLGNFTPSCFLRNLFDPKPILIICGRNVGKGACSVKMFTYLMLSFAVGYLLKCCFCTTVLLVVQRMHSAYWPVWLCQWRRRPVCRQRRSKKCRCWVISAPSPTQMTTMMVLQLVNYPRCPGRLYCCY